MPKYKRPTATTPSKAARAELLREHIEFYKRAAAEDPERLNQKLPKSSAAPLLDRIGALLLKEAKTQAAEGPVAEFLAQNPLPNKMAKRLPDEFRAFCVLLNSVKQWVAAEQAATDRYLLGSNVRDECRAMADHCLVTGASLDGTKIELHHPVRDGRPPIPLSHDGHTQVERQAPRTDDPNQARLYEVRNARNVSWALLRRGCLDHLGQPVSHADDVAKGQARSHAKHVCKTTGLEYEEFLAWLDENELGK